MRYLFIILFLTYTAYASAEDLQFSGEQPLLPPCELTKKTSLSQEALSQWVQKLQKNYKSLNFLEAGFKQSSYLASLDLSEVSEGKMWFQNPGKLRWEYDKPEVQVFLVADEEFQLYQPQENQVIKQDMRSYFTSDVPIAFLLGLGDLEESFVPMTGCKAGDEVDIQFRPKLDRVSSELASLRIVLSASSLTAQAFEVKDEEGNTTSVLLEKVKRNQPFSTNIFALDLPKGVDEQDLRRNG